MSHEEPNNYKWESCVSCCIPVSCSSALFRQYRGRNHWPVCIWLKKFLLSLSSFYREPWPHAQGGHQGDILPVIKYFQFAGRLRSLDMYQPLESIRATVSLHLPHSLFIYLPRVANGIADDLAGQASHFLLARYRSDLSTFNRNAGPVSIKPSFPTALFQVGGFHIQCFEQPWSQPILTLVERPSIDHGLLRKHLTSNRILSLPVSTAKLQYRN